MERQTDNKNGVNAQVLEQKAKTPPEDRETRSSVNDYTTLVKNNANLSSRERQMLLVMGDLKALGLEFKRIQEELSSFTVYWDDLLNTIGFFSDHLTAVYEKIGNFLEIEREG